MCFYFVPKIFNKKACTGKGRTKNQCEIFNSLPSSYFFSRSFFHSLLSLPHSTSLLFTFHLPFPLSSLSLAFLSPLFYFFISPSSFPTLSLHKLVSGIALHFSRFHHNDVYFDEQTLKDKQNLDPFLWIEKLNNLKAAFSFYFHLQEIFQLSKTT